MPDMTETVAQYRHWLKESRLAHEAGDTARIAECELAIAELEPLLNQLDGQQSDQ